MSGRGSRDSRDWSSPAGQDDARLTNRQSRGEAVYHSRSCSVETIQRDRAVLPVLAGTRRVHGLQGRDWRVDRRASVDGFLGLHHRTEGGAVLSARDAFGGRGDDVLVRPRCGATAHQNLSHERAFRWWHRCSGHHHGTTSKRSVAGYSITSGSLVFVSTGRTAGLEVSVGEVFAGLLGARGGTRAASVSIVPA